MQHKTEQYVNSSQVKVSFEVPYDDWCVVEQSDIWTCILNFLDISECRQLPREGKEDLLKSLLPEKNENGKSIRGEVVTSDVEGFKEMCQPIISYLGKHCDPYTEVHISMDAIKVTSVKCGIPVKMNDD